ncbi:MAG: XrtA/PEP-CTERM system-associated ATPase [Parvularculaceae bacterium]
MYEEYFGLSGAPFRLNPDPKFFFGSRSHNKAMAYLHYGVRQAEGFIVITGEVGAGKSILIGHLLSQLNRSSVVAAHLLTSNLNPDDVLGHILSAFRIEPQRSGKSGELEAFEDFLFDQMNRGRRVLLIVDEAQNLPQRTLEELRMLSNLDYEGTPLFQVFLVGQPEFREILAAPEMEQLRQRVIASYHLEPLDERDTRRYVEHRLAVVGWREDPLIADDAYALIHKESGGVPRRINTLCNRILLYCALEKVHEIDAPIVASVVKELKSEGFGAADAKPRSEPARNVRKKAPVEDDVRAVEEEKRKAAGGGNVVFAFNPDRTDQSPGDDGESVQTVGDDAPHREERGPEKHTIWGSEDAPEFRAAGLSEFDRLRALRASAPPEDAEDSDAPPHPATLRDVASAIAAADSEPQPREEEEPEELAAPARQAQSGDWRRSTLRSIGETRGELKTAHESILHMRAALADIENRRRDSREKIAANLARAESLLSGLRGIWR